MNTADVEILASFCRDKLDLTNVHFGDEEYYANVPICVIDAIYSINARATVTQATVKRFCAYFGVREFKYADPAEEARAVEFTIDDLLQIYAQHSIEFMASDVYQNRQRTSPTSGILKAEAVFRVAQVLKKYGVNVLADMPKVINNDAFEAEYKAIPGQNSGISLRYFYMLTGVEDQIKPDRMIIRFISSVLNRSVIMDECHPLLLATCQYLLEKHALDVKPSALDHVIWRFQSAQGTQKSSQAVGQVMMKF
jgi:hypothetical protein